MADVSFESGQIQIFVRKLLQCVDAAIVLHITSAPPPVHIRVRGAGRASLGYLDQLGLATSRPIRNGVADATLRRSLAFCMPLHVAGSIPPNAYNAHRVAPV